MSKKIVFYIATFILSLVFATAAQAEEIDGVDYEVSKPLPSDLQLVQSSPVTFVTLSYKNGFFDLDDCGDIIEDIREKDPWAIFVAMGSPRQEKFIEEHNNELPCKIFMGVGGSFDVFAGNVKRAPKWMINMGLEWLYRVSKEPWRIKRLTSIPKFLWMVFRNKNK